MATKDNGNDLTAMFSRLPSDQLKKLSDLVGSELDKRGGKKNVGGMNDAEFRKYVDSELQKSAAAMRESDLRRMLTSKDKKVESNKSKSTPNDQEIEIE